MRSPPFEIKSRFQPSCNQNAMAYGHKITETWKGDERYFLFGLQKRRMNHTPMIQGTSDLTYANHTYMFAHPHEQQSCSQHNGAHQVIREIVMEKTT